MTETDFVQWLRGFTQGTHHYNVTPKNWDTLKETLNTIHTNTTSYQYTDAPGWTTNIS